MIVGSLSQALAGSAPAINVLGIVIFWRFIVSLPDFVSFCPSLILVSRLVSVSEGTTLFPLSSLQSSLRPEFVVV